MFLSSWFRRPFKTLQPPQGGEFISSYVYHRARALQSNSFVNQRGIQASILMGNKGIGKSTALQYSLKGVASEFDKIMSMYINCERFPASPLQSIGEHVVDELASHNIIVGKSRGNESTQELISNTLERYGLYMFLVIDEVETLWAIHEIDHRFQCAYISLDELRHYASDTSGRICTILCGSTAYLPYLVSSQGRNDPDIVRKYPLVEYVIDLNTDKFQIYRI